MTLSFDQRTDAPPDAVSPEEYLARAARTARSVFERFPRHALDEQAGPAYLEGYVLSRWVFWSRLRKVIECLPETGTNCLDFGCGFGLLLPLLAERCERVAGVDLMPQLAGEFLDAWTSESPLEGTIDVVSDMSRSLGGDSVDLILALDVLEHVPHLDALLDEMSGRLNPRGQLIVSGPTENSLYRLGRRIVGFSGDYHVRSIYEIRRALKRQFLIRRTIRLPRLAPLFHIYVATPKLS